MNRSEISNDFNFEYEVELRGTRKDDEHLFSKSGFGFDDFMDVGDRTMKSDKFESKLQNNASDLSRKEQETSNIIDEISTHSMKRKMTKD
jgi:hypothetical protein